MKYEFEFDDEEERVYIQGQLDLCESLGKELHEGQFRNDGVTPYFEHPKQVAEMFIYKMDWELRCIAYLHDVIEDCGQTVESLIARGVSGDIAHYVDILSHKDGETYAEYILRICKEGRYIIRLKLADMLCNMADEPTGYQKRKYIKHSKTLLEWLNR